ncbi:MAG: site-2 protease family protein [Clostridia bacterium]|nr:site-2 protease family protein [Clostridia bacterium]
MRFSLFGTKIYVSFLFCATLSLMLATDRTGLVIPTLFAALIHETGHLFAMWAADRAPKEIRLIPASVQIIEKYGSVPKKQVGIIISGPLANIMISAAIFINFYLTGSDVSLRFALLNAVIAAFNLLPVAGLDGGRLLELLLLRKTDSYTANRTVNIITIVMACIIFVLGVFLIKRGDMNISVFIVALYLAICAVIKK